MVEGVKRQTKVVLYRLRPEDTSSDVKLELRGEGAYLVHTGQAFSISVEESV